MAIEKTMLDALMNGESTEVEIPEEMGEVLPENINCLNLNHLQSNQNKKNTHIFVFDI